MSVKISADGSYVGFGTQPDINQQTSFYLFDNFDGGLP
jgi:hypothetical protein